MVRAALALLLASARPPLDARVLARILGLDPPGAEAPAPAAAAADWPGQVLGTLVAPVPRLSLAAVFYLPGRSVVTLGVGDVLAGAEVVAISRGAITVRTPEGLRRVGVNPVVPPPPPPPSATPRAVVSAEREFRREDIDPGRLATDARGRPAFENGALVGAQLMWISPGSLYDRAGLRAGDVVQRINGHRLTSPDAALEAYAELRTATWVELEVHRGDSVLLLRYQIH